MRKPLPIEGRLAEGFPGGMPGEVEDGEAKAAFHLRMRAHGVRELAVLRAFERVPRAAFVSPRHAATAARGLVVPIPCGQTMSEPWLVARMIEALRIEPGERVLEVGTGSGYAAAILAQLCRTVIGVERHADLAQSARMRLTKAGVRNAEVVWDDGSSFARDRAGQGFERILIHAIVDDVAPWLPLLRAGATLVCGRADPLGVRVVRIRSVDGHVEAEAICEARLRQLVPGVTGAL